MIEQTLKLANVHSVFFLFVCFVFVVVIVVVVCLFVFIFASCERFRVCITKPVLKDPVFQGSKI